MRHAKSSVAFTELTNVEPHSAFRFGGTLVGPASLGAAASEELMASGREYDEQATRTSRLESNP